MNLQIGTWFRVIPGVGSFFMEGELCSSFSSFYCGTQCKGELMMLKLNSISYRSLVLVASAYIQDVKTGAG